MTSGRVLRASDNLQIVQHRGAIICSPDGRNGGGYVVFPSRKDRVYRKSDAIARSKKAVEPVAVAPITTRIGSLPEPLKMEALLAAVCSVSGISRSDLRADRRYHNRVRARAAFFIIARQDLKRSWSRMARKMGGRDHSTAFSAVKQYGNHPTVMELVRKVRAMTGLDT